MLKKATVPILGLLIAFVLAGCASTSELRRAPRECQRHVDG